MSETEWTVGVAVETVEGERVLRMTQGQARDLLDTLQWLVEHPVGAETCGFCGCPVADHEPPLFGCQTCNKAAP